MVETIEQLNLSNIYISVGASKRPNISDKYKEHLIFSSKSNIFIANQQKIIKRIQCGLSDITFLRIHDDFIFVGDCNGFIFIFEIICIVKLNFKKVYENCVNDSIVTINRLESDKNNILMVTTMDKQYFIEDKKIILQDDQKDLISFASIVKIRKGVHCSLIGCDNGKLKIYLFTEENKKNNLSLSFEAHKSNIKCIKILKTNDRILFMTASLDSTVKIFKLNNKSFESEISIEEIFTLYGHKDWIFGCNWISNNDIITCSADNSIIYWKYYNDGNKEEWKIEARLGGIVEKNQTFYNAISFDDEKCIIAQSISGGFYKYIKENENSYKFNLKNYISGHIDEITSIDIKDDMILTSSLDFSSRIFSLNLFEEIARPQIHGYPLVASKFLQNSGFEIVSGANETIMRVYESTTIFILNYRNRLKDLYEKSIENKNVIIDKNLDNEKDVKTDKLEKNKIYNTKNIFEIDISNYPKIARMSELSLTNEIHDENFEDTLKDGNNERNLSTNFLFSEKQKVYGHFFEIQDIDVSENFVISCNKSSLKKYSGIFVWKIKNNNLLEKCDYMIFHDLGIQRLHFSQDKNLIIACSRDKRVSFYRKNLLDNSNETPFIIIGSFEDHKRVIWDCGISFDNKYGASCSRDKKVIFYNIETMRKEFEIIFECEVTALCFSPKSYVVSFGLENGDVCLCGFKLGKKDYEFLWRENIHSGSVKCLKFDNSGYVLATGGHDGILNVLKISEKN